MAATGQKRGEGLQSPGVPLCFEKPFHIDIPSRMEIPVTYQPAVTPECLRRPQRPVDTPAIPTCLRSVFLRRSLEHDAPLLALHLHAGLEGEMADAEHLAVRLGFQRTAKSAGL